MVRSIQRCEVNARNTDPTPLATGQLVVLRDQITSDVDAFLHWRTYGEWRLWDAPWEGGSDALTSKEELEYRERFVSRLEDEVPSPRQRAVITTRVGKPLGWVSRYGGKDNPLVWFVGIDIGEDDYLNRGYGTEALKLWVNYLFANSEYHKLCLDTWSFNPRMMRVAEKIGFIPEGFQRHMQFWQGEWLDLIHYGLLREECEAKR